MIKTFTSPDYRYIFDTRNGQFMRCGATIKDDPDFSGFGPEILDIEISTICSNGCSFCYKSNTKDGINMSLNTFKKIFEKLPRYNKAIFTTQIAFGIGDIDANPDMFPIFEYCRLNGVVPNVTINGKRMTPMLYDRLVNICGAVAVSLYDYDTCFNAVQELTKRGLKQTNIHMMLSEETYDKCIATIKKIKEDPRLTYLNAIVFLWMKPKGNRNQFNILRNMHKYQELIKLALDNGTPIGFDSCSASNFIKALKHIDNNLVTKYMPLIEPCESTLFSYYINAKGEGYPCSFLEGVYPAVNILKARNFVEDVWNAAPSKEFRFKVLNNKDCNGCRMCPEFNLSMIGEPL